MAQSMYEWNRNLVLHVHRDYRGDKKLSYDDAFAKVLNVVFVMADVVQGELAAFLLRRRKREFDRIEIGMRSALSRSERQRVYN